MKDGLLPQLRTIARPARVSLPRDEAAERRAQHMRNLRSVLAPAYLPPLVVPLRAQIVDTGQGQRLFVELQNLSGARLETLCIEAVLLDDRQHEVDVIATALSELGIAADPQRVVPVGGLDLDPARSISGAIVRTLYAAFDDGTSWSGEIQAVEDPRSSERERALATARFYAPYRGLLRAIEGTPQGALS